MTLLASNVQEFGRRCARCGETKPLAAFNSDNSRRATSRGNVASRCKSCVSQSRTVYPILADDHPDMVNGRRSCIKCGLEKPLNNFGKQRSCPQGRQSTCKRCMNDYRNARRERSGRVEPMEPTKRDYQRRYKYKGLTGAAFKAMFEAQHGKCGICEKEMGFLDKETCVDHDHKSGLVRGILCGKCNRGLGCMEDDVVRIKAAIAYLEKHAGE